MARRQPRILAIDDTPANLIAVGEILGTAFEEQFATSGTIGLVQAIEFPPDLFFLGVMMPEIDGYETCRGLNADPRLRMIPAIFVTALDEIDAETAVLNLGVNGVVFPTKSGVEGFVA